MESGFPWSRNHEISDWHKGIRRSDHATPLYMKKLALNSPTSGGRSVSIVRSRTKATELYAQVLVTFASYCSRSGSRDTTRLLFRIITNGQLYLSIIMSFELNVNYCNGQL
jgi:hypothetical protein